MPDFYNLTDDEYVSRTIIPATPGFFLVDVMSSDEGDGVVKPSFESVPVVAWAITIARRNSRSGIIYYTQTTAVPVDDGFGEHQYIMYPDGRIVDPFNQDWQRKEDFIEDRWNRIQAELAKESEQ